MSFYCSETKTEKHLPEDSDPKTFFDDGGVPVYENEDGEEIELMTSDDLEMLADCYHDDVQIEIRKVKVVVVGAEGDDDDSDGVTIVKKKVYSHHNKQAVFKAAFNNNGTGYVSVGKDKRAVLYDLTTDTVLGSYTGKDTMLCVDYSLHDSVLVGSSHPTVHLLDAKKGLELVQSYKTHKGKVYGVNFFPDGKMFATCSTDGTATAVDVTTSSVVAKYQGSAGVEIYSSNVLNQNVIVFARDHRAHQIHTIDFFDVRSQPTPSSAPSALTNHHSYTIWSLQPSACGNELLSTGWDGEVFLFDIRTGGTLMKRTGFNAPMHRAIFGGAFEQYVITAGRDQAMSILDRHTGNIVTSIQLGAYVQDVVTFGRHALCCTRKGSVPSLVW